MQQLYEYIFILFVLFIGLDAASQLKMETKYDKNLEKEIIDWINATLAVQVNDFIPDLKSGVILCKFEYPFSFLSSFFSLVLSTSSILDLYRRLAT